MLKNITILGVGTMGYGIAISFALANFKVRLFDINADQLKLAAQKIATSLQLFEQEGLHQAQTSAQAKDCITYYKDRTTAVQDADIVIEAMPENLQLKQEIFATLDQECPAQTIFGSNTSSLAIKDIFAKVSSKRKQQCIITHYFNPAEIIPLVELLGLPETSAATFTTIETIYKQADKVTIRLKQDLNGMIGNRLQIALLREALWLVENKMCSFEDLGRALAFGPCFRGATADYLRIIDLGGLDIWNSSATRLYPEINSSHEVNKILKDKVQAGKLGLKTGEGFYEYSDADKTAIPQTFIVNLLKQLKLSRNFFY